MIFYKYTHDLIWNKKRFNKADFMIIQIDSQELKNNKFYFLYLMEKDKFVLGNKETIEESNCIYLYESDKDEYFKLEEIMEDKKE